MPESIETIIARMDERLKANNDMTLELLKIVKGDNSQGLITRMAIVEQQQGNCPKVQQAVTSIKWLTWGFRVITAAIIGGFFWLIRNQ